MAGDRKPSDYDVGYGRPPRGTRYKKGQSGNPKGKAPGRKNLKTEILAELSEKIPVTDNGKRRLVSKQTVIVKRLVSDAAKGDARARDQLLRLINQFEPPGDGPAREAAELEADADILARFRAQLLAELKGQT